MTLVATFSNSELRVKPASSVAGRFASNRILFSWGTNSITPPFSAKSNIRLQGLCVDNTFETKEQKQWQKNEHETRNEEESVVWFGHR
jgi:hypothetical protein